MYAAPRRPVLERLLEKVDKNGSTQPHMDTPCHLWTGAVGKNGYGSIGLGGRYGKTQYVHIVVWESEHGPVPAGKMVLHACDVKLCVRHLYLGDHAQNMADRQRRGRTASGDRAGTRTKPEAFPRGSARTGAKLTEEQVLRLRAEASTTTQRVLAERYGVSDALVCRILQRKTWKHI